MASRSVSSSSLQHSAIDTTTETDDSIMERRQMWSRAARIESFTTASANKNNTRNSSHSSDQHSTDISTVWPHSHPTPEQLAHAGFFFHNANSQDKDSTKCFSCGLKLDGWEPDDDPLREHYAHGKKSTPCAWTISLSVRRDQGEEQDTRDPFADELFNARKDTFADRWPHENKRSWRCKVERMVEAGWSYDPYTDGADEVCCHYCDLRLSEFKARDDPYEEHRRRRPDCTFFRLVDHYHNGEPPKRPKPKAKIARANRSSKAARASVQSVMSTAGPEPIDNDDAADDDELHAALESDSEPVKTKKAKRSTTTKRNTTSKSAKSTTSQAAESQSTQDMERDLDTEDDAPRGKKTKTASKKAAQPRKGRAKNGSNMTQRTTDVSTQLQDELETSVLESSPNYWVNPDQRSSMLSIGASKRSSDGSLKYGAFEDTDFDFPLPPSTTHDDQPKAKRAKTAPSSKLKTDAASNSKATSRTKTSAVPHYHDDEDEIAQELARIESEEKVKASSQRQSKQSRNQNVIQVREDESDDNASVDEEPPVQNTSTHKQRPSPVSITPSPAGSDKENNPSSLDTVSPSKNTVKAGYTSPTKTSRIPLAQTTPNRPSPHKAATLDSPSKRQLGNITSSLPWKPIDLDTILLDPAQDTPGKLRQQLADAAGVLSKEESAMTVEGWIRWRASLCEDEAKRRCEEMVALFEREGNRALECLHGLKITA